MASLDQCWDLSRSYEPSPREESGNRGPASAAPVRGASLYCQFDFFRTGIVGDSFCPIQFQQLADSDSQIIQALAPRLTLTISTRNFQTSRPVTAFLRFSVVQNSRELLHKKGQYGQGRRFRQRSHPNSRPPAMRPDGGSRPHRVSSFAFGSPTYSRCIN